MAKMEEDYPNIHRLGGEIYDVRRLIDPANKNWGATNLSIFFHPKKGWVGMLRSSNYVIRDSGTYHVTEGATIKSRIYIGELDANFKFKELRAVDLSEVKVSLDRGLEDPKLFWRDGALHFTCVTMEKEHTPIARMAICKLDPKLQKVVSFEKFPGIDALRPEKNWAVASEPSEEFDFIYGPNSTIKDGMLNTWMTDNKEISALRGNTNLVAIGDGTYLGVSHRMFGKPETRYVPQTFGTVSTYTRGYVHYFVRYDKEGYIEAVSKGFIFFKPGVEFAAGLVVKDKKAYISFGRDDLSSHVAVLPVDLVMKSLQPVHY